MLNTNKAITVRYFNIHVDTERDNLNVVLNAILDSIGFTQIFIVQPTTVAYCSKRRVEGRSFSSEAPFL